MSCATIFRIRLMSAAWLLMAAWGAAVAAEGEIPARYQGATPLAWSERLARSEMARRGSTLFFGGGAPLSRWDYTNTLFGLSLIRLSEQSGQPEFAAFGARTATSFLGADGAVVATYKRDDYNLDMVAGGKVLLALYEQGKREAPLKAALALLREQMRTQPRTSEGGYWHKLRYPDQMWLDGLFMASPFLAQYAKVFEEPALFDDVARQFLIVDAHAFDPKTGLYRHAWDEKKAQPWADKQTGLSPQVWSRAMGWYAMGLVDSLDYFSPTHPEVERLNEVLRRIADGIVRWQDPKTGLWWQVMDQGSRTGNYLEATASSMFVYALAKGINRGYLSRERYLAAAVKGYEGIVRDFIHDDGGGRISLTRCCEVAGLGYTNAKGRARDGSFDYYVSEPIIDNDLKGVGPFILAGLEMQTLATRAPAALAVRGWNDYERVAARIRAPVFPARDFLITDFGARPEADATDAIRAAIDRCHQSGGGRVVVPPGVWRTGAVHLRSQVNLHVSAGATLRFTFDLEKYPLVFTRWEGVECMNYSALIYAFEQENVAVTGSGTLDGGADETTWWAWNSRKDPVRKQKADRDRLIQMGEENVPVAQRVFGPGHFLRPNFIQPYRCRNVLIEGLTLIRSPMWEVHPVLSENVTVRGLKIRSHGPNNDGCDPESCRDVLIEDCVFDTGDDCIAIKSGRNGDGRRVNQPTENVIVRRCVMKDGHGGVVLGSECTGGIRNVFVEDCEMDSPELDRALRFKNNAVRGGILENVFMRNVRIGRVGEAVLTIDLLYEEGARGPFKPVVRNVQMENITSSASPRVLFIRGFPGAVVDDIRLRNSTFNGVTQTEVVEHAGSITLQNVTIVPASEVRGLNSVAPSK